MKREQKHQPIGIIDSGVGGISVLQEICVCCSSQKFYYIADTAWCPYGTKSADEITNRVNEHTNFLLKKGCGSIVIACNSATISSISELRSKFSIPIIGMEPAVKPAAKITSSGVIGIFATETSLTGGKFQRLLDCHSKGIKVITTACPKFVELVERGKFNGSEVQFAVEQYTAPMLKAGADVLVLGCTHYPFLRASIEQFVGGAAQIIDTGSAVAKQVIKMTGMPKIRTNRDHKIVIFTSGDTVVLERTLSLLCPELNASISKLI